MSGRPHADPTADPAMNGELASCRDRAGGDGAGRDGVDGDGVGAGDTAAQTTAVPEQATGTTDAQQRFVSLSATGAPPLAAPNAAPRVYAQAEWQAREAAHSERLQALLGDYPEWRRQNRKHPVLDFLFTYYSFSLGRLQCWTPGWGAVLQGPAARRYLRQPDAQALNPYAAFPDIGDPASAAASATAEGGVGLDLAVFPAKRLPGMRWMVRLLRATAERPPHFGCFGLHEWAMVYQADATRHPVPLRLGEAGTNALVASSPITCTHYDAYRFFTEPARPLNRLKPRTDDRVEHEQPACLHANMDLYKWAYKLYPWLPSELLLDCFALALEARTLDMRASPYDLRQLGYSPIAIETPEGRQHYVAGQQALAERAAPIRRQLHAAITALADAAEAARPAPPA